jgi:D-alanyl-D-alanine endopeptidase (penicillin-binding protein 7)
MFKRSTIILLSFMTTALPAVVLAAPNEAVMSVYWNRPDLQAAFDPYSFRSVPNSPAGYLIDLEDWAYQYGWREYPELSAYAPPSTPPTLAPRAAVEPSTTASSYIVIDRTSGQVLAARNANTSWPIASLTKLVTSEIVLDAQLSLSGVYPVSSRDDVGGAKLYVNDGDTFTLDGLMYATLIASANNAANAISHTTGLSKTDFVAEMNRRAIDLNLYKTKFVDPTGIETGNVSTAREFSRLANQVFSRKDIRRYTTTPTAEIAVLSQGTTKRLTSTDWMLWKPEYDDIYVMAGKTGYLEESGWNFAVCLRPTLDEIGRELLIVEFGSASRADSFVDARALADWAWDNYQWPR